MPASATAITLVTVGVTDLAEALTLFRDTMGFVVERQFDMSAELRRAWNLPDGTTAKIVELSYGGYPRGRLRLASFQPVPTVKVRNDRGPHAPDRPTDVGPKAIDVYVRPPIQHAMAKMEALGYVKRADPVTHHVDDIISEELVYWGPDGLPILLMVGHVHPPDQQRSPTLEGDFSEIATISVVSADRKRSAAFYRDLLGMHCFNDSESGAAHRDNVSTLTGAPAGSQIHWQTFGEAKDPSGKILLIHFFEATGKRLQGRMRPGHLGFSMMTLEHPDIEDLAARAKGLGFEVPTAPTAVDYGGTPARFMLLRGPNEEMFEIVQAR
jgi:catechol 2,3-dioxygenase-like lactoylglutathione lyase family enzyme